MATNADHRVIDVFRPESNTSGERPSLEEALRGKVLVSIAGPEGVPVRLPAAWQDSIVRLVREVAAGHWVRVVVDTHDEIGTKELAAMLAVSRPTAAALLDQGSIPSHRTPKGHRRTRRADVAAYLRQRQVQRDTLAALQSRAEEQGHPMFSSSTHPVRRRPSPPIDPAGT